MRLTYQFHLIQAIRNFFNQAGFIDVMTPPVVTNPGMETHIHPFKVSSTYKNRNENFYLQTSPEFHMKELLSLKDEELSKIFNISYCFRDEPESDIHRSQFLMLEWYRKDEHYTSIMEDVLNLVKFCVNEFQSKELIKNSDFLDFKPEKVTVAELFKEYCQMNILDYLDAESLEAKLRSDFKDIPVPDSKLIYEDSFFLIFLNMIEPHFKNFKYLEVSEYPAPLAALSTLKVSDPRVCERFEVYLKGIELCNCFNELTDLNIQKERFKKQNQEKQNLYGYSLPNPDILYNALERGLPKSSGIALGVERLLYSLFEIKNPFYR